MTIAALAMAAALAGGMPDPGLDSRIAPLFADSRQGTPGCAVAVVRRGRIAYSRGFGEADLAARAAITPDTIFYAASLSKQFTALAAAQLVARGKLSLDDEVQRWLPELPRYAAPVTVGMLMHHSAGIRDVLGLASLAGVADYSTLSRERALALLFRQRSTNFAPGTRFLYSNGGYLLLSEIVARASGRPFAEQIRRDIFDPLGMRRSYFRGGALRAGTVAHGYAREAAGWAQRDEAPGFSGAGGLMTSISDLARFDRDLLVGKRVWTHAVRRILLTPGRLADGTPTRAEGADLTYAGGLNVGQRDGHDWVTHNGAQGPFRGTMSRLPDLGLSAAVLCNRSDAATETLAGAVLHAIAPEIPLRSVAAPAAPPVPQGPIGTEFLGRFRSDEFGATYVIAEIEGRVRVRVVPDGGGPALPFGGECGALSADAIGNGRLTLRLRRAADGQVIGLTASTPNVLALDLDRI